MVLLGELGWGQAFLGMLIVGVCLFLMLVILLQRGRGTGLAGAFGGGGSSAFGAKTGDVFTWITVVVASVFILLAIVGNFVFEPTEYVEASAPTVESGAADSKTITLPLEEGVDADGVKVEMITPEGAVIPIETTIREEPAGTSDAPAQPAPGSDQPKEEPPPPAGTENQTPPSQPPPQDQPKQDEPKEPGR
jgi:preprotein translocase subunit SecG